MNAPALPSVSSRTATIAGADGPLAVYEASPADATAAVIVLHEAFGVTDHIADVVRRAADVGYHAIAPDLFHRSGGGVAPYGDLQAAANYFSSMTDDGVLADVTACIDHLIALGFTTDRIGVVGFCFGGRAAFLTAARRQLGAAVTLYGGGIVTPNPFLPFPALTDDVATMKTPWIGLYGEEDHGIPQADVDALEAALVGACPVDHRIVRYAGAGHAFHNDQLPSYHEEAAKAAWSEGLQWLAAHGVAP
jgi:carboxymethylenebutenolidase